ncbi:hypothetical protein D9M71_592460 [compost metagenome]
MPHAFSLPAIEAITCAIVEALGQCYPRVAGSTGDHRRGDIRGVETQRHVGPIAELGRQRHPAAGLDTVDAQPVQADVLGEGRSIRRPLSAPGEIPRQRGVARIDGQVRQARVVVDEVQRRLGIVERRQQLAQGEAELAVVGRRRVAP